MVSASTLVTHYCHSEGSAVTFSSSVKFENIQSKLMTAIHHSHSTGQETGHGSELSANAMKPELVLLIRRKRVSDNPRMLR